MSHLELAARLAAAAPDEQRVLLAGHPTLATRDLALALQAEVYSAWATAPQQVVRAASGLLALDDLLGDPEVHGLATWASGIAALLEGAMERAVAQLDEAEASFLALDLSLAAARTQVSKLYPLSILGYYDQAIQCGQRALAAFDQHGDALAAGKVEQNLGNLFYRRDRYPEAEAYYQAARSRFDSLGDEKQLIQVENGLATLRAAQYRFREAAQLYEQALERAAAAGLQVTQAEIECNLGELALFQGQYERALAYLEQSRRRYESLDMPHESAIAEQQLADAYLEINLAPEADSVYGRVIPTFERLGMTAERARALACQARSRALVGEYDEAERLLSQARDLYQAEENKVGEATVGLIEAQIAYARGDYEHAAGAAARAASGLEDAGTGRRNLLATWLQGEAARARGARDEAREILARALENADQEPVPHITQRCHTSLGLLAAAEGAVPRAEAAFRQAVMLIEEMRAPLPGEEFRLAFIGDKLTPFTELVRICLADGTPDRIAEALGYVEQVRSRALLDTVAGALPSSTTDPESGELLERLARLRGELNWFYAQLERGGDASADGRRSGELHDAVREREEAILTIGRQLQQGAGAGPSGTLLSGARLDLSALQRELGPETALVEYFTLDDELLAFVVTAQDVVVERRLGVKEDVEIALRQLTFQTDSLRHGHTHLAAHMEQLTARARHYLATLYDILIRRLAPHLANRRVVIVPHQALHYVPFHALYDGREYLIEGHEVCYAPSANVLAHCLAAPHRQPRRALLVGVSDPAIPWVRDEITTIAPLFPEALTLLNGEATLSRLRGEAAGIDILHLACHGQFRPDSPLFSALHLADGRLTVRDASRLPLADSLVTLSACETGLNAVAPGDELVGLARGFISAGARSLLVTLWRVDDRSAAALMETFYRRLQAGERPGAALRYAQRELLNRQPHPFFWAPFSLIGRW